MATLRSSSGRSADDAVAKWLAISSFAAFILILTMGLWIAATGIMDPPAPRSYNERQIEMLELIVQQKPKVPRAWADLARAYTVSRQFSSAERVLARGEAAVGKKSPELNLERARLLVFRGKEAEAIKQADLTLKVTKEFRAKEMERLATKATTIDPRTVRSEVMAQAATIKAELLAGQRKWAEAEKAYSIAINEAPTDAGALVKRGLIYIELGNKKKAKADFDQALKYIPGYEPALKGLKRLEKGTSK